MNAARSSPIALFVWTITASISAHSDPHGDTYPNVKVEHGDFVIEFESNETEDNTPRPVFRMIYSPEGELLAPRYLHAPSRSLEETMGETAKNTAESGDEKIEFNDSRSENPTYDVTKNGRTQTHNLPWPDNYRGAFEAMWSDADSICVASISDERMYLLEFDRHHFTAPKMVQVSEPGALPFIWDSPVMSNIVRVGHRYYVAWVRLSADRQKYESVISSWKPGESKTKEIIPTEPADWNSHLSLAAIGNHFCLAYHSIGRSENPERSNIITIFRTVPND